MASPRNFEAAYIELQRLAGFLDSYYHDHDSRGSVSGLRRSCKELNFVASANLDVIPELAAEAEALGLLTQRAYETSQHLGLHWKTIRVRLRFAGDTEKKKSD